MPWKAGTVADERASFVLDYKRRVLTKEITMRALCEEHTIPRKTAYKFVARYKELGWRGLEDQSRAPHSGRHWSDEEVVRAVIDVRLRYPSWGSKKIIAYLHDTDPDRQWPVPSVAHEWIRRSGLVERRKRQQRFPHPGAPPTRVIESPNQQWSTDFKGQFRTRDGRYCYPLTVVDSFSRYIIDCHGLIAPTFELSKPVFERLFRKYGLPDAILSDNGTPFSSNSLKRLSKLSVWWIRVGVEPRLTQPGKPQQNGRLERMHRTLKEEVCVRPSANLRRQQIAFNEFVETFNHVRPHESLSQTPPARSYSHSPRSFPNKLQELVYPSTCELRRVRSSGEIKWKGNWFFVSEALVGEIVAFEPVDDETSILRFGPLELGYYSDRERRLCLDRPSTGSKVPEP